MMWPDSSLLHIVFGYTTIFNFFFTVHDTSSCPSTLKILGLVAAGSALPVEESEGEAYVTLVLDWAMNWGTWGPQEFCPAGTFAYAFQIKVRMSR